MPYTLPKVAIKKGEEYILTFDDGKILVLNQNQWMALQQVEDISIKIEPEK